MSLPVTLLYAVLLISYQCYILYHVNLGQLKHIYDS